MRSDRASSVEASWRRQRQVMEPPSRGQYGGRPCSVKEHEHAPYRRRPYSRRLTISSSAARRKRASREAAEGSFQDGPARRGSRDNSGDRSSERHGVLCHGRKLPALQVGAKVRELARADAEGELQRKEAVARVDQQGRRPVPKDAPDRRGTVDDPGRPPHEKTASPSGMGAGGREEARAKPRRRGRRKQARTDHLGRLDARRAVQAAVRHSEHSEKRSCLKRTKPDRAFPPTHAKDATDEHGPTDTGTSR